MFQQRPLTINYLGYDSGYKFFVNVADVNYLIYGTRNIRWIDIEPFEFFAEYNGVYDNLLNPIELFDPEGQNGYLTEFISPLKISFTINESSSIFIKIPKIPAGASPDNNESRNIFFISRADQFSIQNALFWKDEFRISSILDPEDFNYNKKYDPFQRVLNVINFPIDDEGDDKGNLYIKIADIIISDSGIRIKQFFQSDIFIPNRYITMGINGVRNLSVHFLAKNIFSGEDNYELVEGYYSRPNWIIKSLEEIFANAFSDITNDFLSFYSIWEEDSGGIPIPVDDFQILQIYAIYTRNANEKIRVKKVFESPDDEELFTPLTSENLSLIIPELNDENAVVE